jgi:hypothetical protein
LISINLLSGCLIFEKAFKILSPILSNKVSLTGIFGSE